MLTLQGQVVKVWGRGSLGGFGGCVQECLLRDGHCRVEELSLSPAQLPHIPKLHLWDQRCQAVPWVWHSPSLAVPSPSAHRCLSCSPSRHPRWLSQPECPTVRFHVCTFLIHSLNFSVPRGVFISIYPGCYFAVPEGFCQAADSSSVLKESTTC